MPLYEFQCEKCHTRFERLAEAGAEAPACPECGGPAARAYSTPAPSPHLVKTPAGNRKQERRNAEMMKRAKARHKETLTRVRAARERKRTG